MFFILPASTNQRLFYLLRYYRNIIRFDVLVLKDINESLLLHSLLHHFSYNWINSTRQVWVDVSRLSAFSRSTRTKRSVIRLHLCVDCIKHDSCD